MPEKLPLTLAASLFPPDIGGPSTYTGVMAEKLLDCGFAVGVAAFGRSAARQTGGQSFRLVRTSRHWPRGLRHLVYTVRLAALTRRSWLIFAQNATSVGLPAWLAAKLWRRPMAVKIVIDSAVEVARATNAVQWARYAKRQGGGLRGWLQRFIARRADLVIVPCRYLEKVVAGWGVPSQRIVVVYNGVQSPKLIAQADAKAKLGLSGRVILTVGRLVPGKGMRMLVKVMPRLLELVSPHLKLVVVGDGPDAANLRQMAANLRLPGKVVLAGRKTPAELADYYAAADVFVLNSFSEGFSHVILEALAAGRPVVTTRTGGNPEIIADGKNGFLLAYNDEAGLVETIKLILQNDELAQQLAVAGQRSAQAFSVERMANATAAALKTLIV